MRGAYSPSMRIHCPGFDSPCKASRSRHRYPASMAFI
nr:MAG TPA: hypothetical protein [Caudoviricetes sp.]